MIKTSFVLVFALMVSASFAQYLLDPAALFSPEVNNTLRPTVENLRMLNTPVNQRAAIRYIFAEADRDGNGLISREELSGVYGILSRPFAQGFSEEYVQTEYDQGGFIREDDQIGLDELAYLLDRQFLFWYNNRQVYASDYNNNNNDNNDNTDNDNTEVNVIDNVIVIDDNNENGENTEDGFNDDNDDARYTLQDTINQSQANGGDIEGYFANLFDEVDVDQSNNLTYEEFENGLEEVGDHFGLDFSWNDGHLREYYGLLLADGENTINRELFDQYAPSVLRNLVEYSYGLLPATQ